MANPLSSIAQRLSRLSLQQKILAVGSLLPATIIAALLFMYSKEAQDNAIQTSVDKARSICLTAESAREQTEKQWASGIFSHEVLREWGQNGEDDKVLSTVPVVTAWETAMAKAEEGGYRFRVPALQPRNSGNAADPLETEALRTLERDGIDEYFVVNEETNSVHYFRPVRLGESCLNCHGNPNRSQELWGLADGVDITGHQMENWDVGQMHGAFEVIQSLDEANAAASSSIFFAIMVAAGCLSVATLITWTTLKSVTSRIETSTKAIAKSILGVRHAAVDLENDAKDAAGKSTSVSSSVTEMSQNINNVSEAIGQISQSVHEIAERASDTTSIADDAVREADTTREVIAKLGQSSSRIDEVTKAINSLAEQTNLLALNATIEAARAGEYGRGFAVVANEVKELAKETSKATEGISAVVSSIQEDTTTAISSVERIHEVISKIHEGQHAVSTAVEEQSSMTSEISRNIGEISRSSGEISQNMTDMAEGSEGTLQRVRASSDLISDIEKVSEELPVMVGLK